MLGHIGMPHLMVGARHYRMQNTVACVSEMSGACVELERIMMHAEPFRPSGFCQHADCPGSEIISWHRTCSAHRLSAVCSGPAQQFRPLSTEPECGNTGGGCATLWTGIDDSLPTKYGREEIAYGDGMVAAKVCDFAWCTRCLDAGSRLLHHAAANFVTTDELHENEDQELFARRAIHRANGHN